MLTARTTKPDARTLEISPACCLPRLPKAIASYAQFRDLVMIAAVMIEAERLADAGVNLDDPACAPLPVPSESLAALNRDPARVAGVLGLSPSPEWRPSARYA